MMTNIVAVLVNALSWIAIGALLTFGVMAAAVILILAMWLAATWHGDDDG